MVVTGTAEDLVPVDSGEKSAPLSSKELDNSSVGSNAAEYIKIMPGFGIQNGTTNAANYNGQTIGINANGNAGSQSPLNNAYSYNGLPSNTLDITADGAHVSDPGCNCDTPVNPNADMIAEFKITMSNFSAENQKGPAVISSVAKSGGTQFPRVRLLFRPELRAERQRLAFQRAAASRGRRTSTTIPGGTLGGPVLIPGTRFNKSRNKLFFFTGYEYFYQVLDTGLLRVDGSHGRRMSGQFLARRRWRREGNITASGAPPGPDQRPQHRALSRAESSRAAAIDPNMQALMKLYPAPNADPNANGGYNWTGDVTFNQNNMQWMSRVDYNISDNTKLFVRYNLQRENAAVPGAPVVPPRPPSSFPIRPPVVGKNRSDSVTASLTHVFSPTMTNEFVFGYTYIGFPNVFQDPSKVDPRDGGLQLQAALQERSRADPQLRQAARKRRKIYNYGGFEVGGPSGGPVCG